MLKGANLKGGRRPSAPYCCYFTKKGNVVNECLCGLYLHYVSRQTFEVWRLWSSVYKNFSRKTSRILTSGQNIQKPSVEHKHHYTKHIKKKKKNEHYFFLHVKYNYFHLILTF